MKIFSFKHTTLKTKITILGFKFSIKHYRDQTVVQNYAQKLAELQNAWGGVRKKIKVGFLINEEAKWQYQSVYEDMEKSDYFEPVVLVTQLLSVHRHKKNFYKTIEDCYNFFKNKGLNVRYVYETDQKRYIPAKEFGVDIVFYQQPWQLDDSQHPVTASKTCLTCYVPYGLHLVNFFGSYMSDFHKLLWLMFVENEKLIENLSKLIHSPVVNCAATGYPKLDVYLKTPKTPVSQSSKPTVIYAPHHSFEANGLLLATFHLNGVEILKMAQEYQEQFNWVFKPHPRFKTAVVTNHIMSEAEIEKYYAEWQKIGTIFDSGDYFNLFEQSAALITDCCSFLGEYLPTGKPVFHLIHEEKFFNDWAKSFLESYYKIYDMENLKTEFKRVMIDQDDYKQKERLSKIKLLYDTKVSASTKIMNILKEKLLISN